MGEHCALWWRCGKGLGNGVRGGGAHRFGTSCSLHSHSLVSPTMHSIVVVVVVSFTPDEVKAVREGTTTLHGRRDEGVYQVGRGEHCALWWRRGKGLVDGVRGRGAHRFGMHSIVVVVVVSFTPDEVKAVREGTTTPTPRDDWIW
jgi:hypothetical protein